ncbi:MAG TPA: exo-alpha-sialidase [Pirellulaceae bacterium]|nr:exo-alpha-sialidase [Pirellulaceae bacterium]
MWRSAVLAVCLVCGSRALLAEERPVEILRLSQASTESGVIDYAALPRLGGTHAVISTAALDLSAIDLPKIDLHNIRFQLHNYLVSSFPVVGVRDVQGFRPDEPIFWPLSDKTLFALYRDNNGSQRLFHSTSEDGGRSRGKPLMTNFPNATSKLFSMQTSRGYRVLVLNANPAVGRRELHLAISEDGRVFTRLALLDIPSPATVDDRAAEVWHKFRSGVASLQYPHVIEHDDHLLIAFSRNKHQTEILRVSLDDIDVVRQQR